MKRGAGIPSRPVRLWPQVVEIEVNSRCNRRCGYCPNATLGRPSVEKFMARPLYDRIVDQLAEIEFSGRLSFHFFNEPLLRKDLAELVARARERLPFAFLVLYTNGDMLDDEHHAALLAAGIDRFLVTRHDWDSFPARPYQLVQHPDNFILSGRGGSVVSAPQPLDLACHAASEMMIITVNGDVVLCHEDAQRENVMGNLGRESIEAVWFGPSFRRVRGQLECGDRRGAARVCGACDNRLYPIPGGAI